MIIDKAIEILSEAYFYKTILIHLEDDEALNLAIEALKWVKAQRDMDIIGLLKLLPGETKE